MLNILPTIELKLTISLNLAGQGEQIVQQVVTPISTNVVLPEKVVTPVNEVTLPVVVPVQTEVQLPAESASLVDLYVQLLSAQDAENRVSVKTIRGNHSVLNRFQNWCIEKELVVDGDIAKVLELPTILKEYAEYLRSQQKGNSASMCSKALATIIKLSNACVKAKVITVRADGVRKGTVNMMRPRTEIQRRVKAVPVALDELGSMLSVLDDCQWPRFGNVSPAKFWETCLLSHYVYGFRSQDWYASRCSEKPGLLWTGVIESTECPTIQGLHNDPGWVFYLVNKTALKDEASGRDSDVLMPLSRKMRSLLEEFRGIDPERVFPMANNSRSYSAEFGKILERAKLSDKIRTAAGKPIIRLSLGQRNVASFRKGCGALWAKYLSRAASSYILHHAVAEEGVSKTTTDCYLQGKEILWDITAKIETLPIWNLCS